MTGRLELIAPDGIGEVSPGDDLAEVVIEALDLREGDVLALTSKVVSKAEGRLVQAADRTELLAGETVRVVARRDAVRIVENHLGLVMAAAGIDNSNVPAGSIALLPRDPDASARALREAIAERTGRNVAVVVTDTAGRAWRLGQSDIAIGCAGISPLIGYDGARDRHGNELAVTAPAVADEIAGAAELVATKLGNRPLVLLRGLAEQVLPAGEHGPGARALVRSREEDMFHLGSREAVVAALSGEPDPGSPASAHELGDALDRCGVSWRASDQELTVDGADLATGAVVRALAAAHAWGVRESDGAWRLRPLR